ncbi:MAG: peptidase C69 [Bacteroidetes bacterium]|nr:MAG: peptidase C69 [Bacteroidota bacterium]
MKNLSKILFLLTILNVSIILNAQVDKTDWVNGKPDGCTAITVGKKASADGSVMNSHTDDSHRTRSWMDIIPPKKHKSGDNVAMYKRTASDKFAMPTYEHTQIGSIPQVEQTFGYINTAYPAMNTKQLACGESTFGGRHELQSNDGLIDCQRLIKLMLERCTTAREAIEMAGKLTKKYGWNDEGECITISDKKEVWHLEIMGIGKGKTGSVWAAQRVPDNHISVNANASTIKHIDLNNTDYFMASDNIYSLAKKNGWWNGNKEEFQFCYVYAPESRNSFASRRREWQVFNLVAPSLKLDPNDKDYPFSVKPDKQVTLEKMVEIFKDYYEGTPFDMVKNIKSTNKEGKSVISPFANPFMPYDMYELFKINGGWNELGERTIARWYTMYGTIIQSRDWLPDEIGGVVWLAQDNIATSVYIPIYCGVTDLPKSYKTPGRIDGFTRESAWWAFNRLSTLTAQRWGDIRHDVDAIWNPLQKKLFEQQNEFEKKALNHKGKKRIEFLTEYTIKLGTTAVQKAWRTGDFIWTKYDEKF